MDTIHTLEHLFTEMDKLDCILPESFKRNVVLLQLRSTVSTKKNLCSLSKITGIVGTRVNLTEDNVTIQKKGENSVKLFSRIQNDNLYRMICMRIDAKENALIVKDKTDIKLLHRRLGHPSYDYTKRTASLYDIKWEGEPVTCEGCAMGKGQQKAVKKSTENRAKERYERLFVDISSLPDLSLKGSKFWVLLVDDATRYKWSYFIQTKDEILSIVEKFFISKLNKYNIRYLMWKNVSYFDILHVL